jgi:hypothetical protein
MLLVGLEWNGKPIYETGGAPQGVPPVCILIGSHTDMSLRKSKRRCILFYPLFTLDIYAKN